MIRVFIADDHEVVRSGLRRIVDEFEDISVVGEASNGNELLSMLKKPGRDIVVMDLSMPGMNGLDIILKVRKLYPDEKVLVYTMYPEDQFAYRSLEAGASGYVTKDSNTRELIQAIRLVAAGKKYISHSFAEQLFDNLHAHNTQPLHEKLSGREFQVFRMLASGMTVTEISQDLEVSIKTVSTHKTRLMEKMNFANISDIIKYAILQNIID